jgi:hypothetical protein
VQLIRRIAPTVSSQLRASGDEEIDAMKVFVCYSRYDEAAVEALANELKSAAQDVWYDRDLRGGSTWWQTILEQIRSCTVVIFAVSDRSTASKPCQAELRYAQQLQIPVLFLIIGEVTGSGNSAFTADAIDYRDSSRAGALALMSALHERAGRRRPLPDPLPEPPQIPYGFLLRIGGMIRSSEEISFDEQRSMLLDLEGGLEDDDDTVRDDVRKLLLALRARSDVTYTTASRIDEILRSHALAAPTATTSAPPVTTPPPAVPVGGSPQFAPLAGPTNWPPPPPGRGGSSGNAKLIWAGVVAAVIVVAIVVAVLVWPKSDVETNTADGSTSSSSSSSSLTSTPTSTSTSARSAADEAFLKAIKGKGITIPSEDYAIETAKQVCQLLDEDVSAVDVASQISKNSGIEIGKAGFFVGASIGAYCPEHMDQAK